MTTIDCPSNSQLKRLLLGQLSEEKAKPLEEHFAKCPRCAARAQTLTLEDTLVDAMGSYDAPASDEAEVVESLVDKLRRAAAASSSAPAYDLDGVNDQAEHESDGDKQDLYQRMQRIVGADDAAGEQPSSGLYDFLAPAESDGELGRLGPYRVLKVLGTGGMGVVFSAEDTQLQRKVALKAMLPTLAASAHSRRRFLQEARAAAAIEHDHVVTIYQVGEDRGIPYLAMPLLAGETLDDRLIGRRRRLPLAEALRIGREVADGLAAAHASGLIHRDIKPGNIWLEGEAGRVKLLDFGLARASDDDQKLTGAGTILGTPGFMAPEQARGEKADYRCDLFSLGCVLYLLTTGIEPFEAPDKIAALRAVSEHDPPPPIDLNWELPPQVSELIVQLLSKRREQRPESAAKVVERIRQFENLVEKSPALSESGRHAIVTKQSTPGETAEQAQGESTPVTVVASKTINEQRAPAGKRRIALPQIESRAGRMLMVGTLVALLAVIATGLAFAPGIYRIATNQGLLVVETTDADVEVTIKQRGKEVQIVDKKTGRQLNLTAGKYEIELSRGRKGLKLSTDSFTLERGGKSIVRVYFEPPPEKPPAAKTPAAKPYEVPQVEELAAWLKGREILTVAQDGSGMFDTIQAALDALKPGQVVEVLDRGPYHERLTKALPEDVGLISHAGARIEFDWHRIRPGFADEQKSLYRGCDLTGSGGFRLSGIQFVYPGLPKDAEFGSAVFLAASGEVVVESCQIRTDALALRGPPPGELADIPHVRSIEYLPYHVESGPTARFFARQNRFDGAFLVAGEVAETVVIERNLIGGWERGELGFHTQPRWSVVRHNIIRGWSGIRLLWRPEDAQLSDARCLVANNVLEVAQQGLMVWPRASESAKQLPARHVRIQNNLIRSRHSGGVNMAADDLQASRENWQIDHNAYLVRPKAIDRLRVADAGETDLILKSQVLASDLSNADFMRIAADSPLATGGAGGDLPSYIGAFPPGPAPSESDWIAPLRADLEESPLAYRHGYIRRLLGHSSQVNAAAFSADGRKAITGSVDGTLRLWELASGRQLQTLTGHTGGVWGADLSPDGRFAISGEGHAWQDDEWIDGKDFDIRLWDLTSGNVVRRFKGHTQHVNATVFYDNGRRILSASYDGTARIWDVKSGNELRRFETDSVPVRSAAISPGGTLVAAACGDGVVRLWSVENETLVRSFKGHTDVIDSVAFSPDARRIVSGSWDSTARVWDVESGKQLFRVEHPERVYSVAISPSGSYAMSAGRDRSVCLWDLETGRRFDRFTGHSQSIEYLALSRDGRYLLSCANDNSARLWGLPLSHRRNEDEVLMLAGHDDQVARVAFTPDGRRAVTSSADMTMRLWDLETGEQILRYGDHSGGIWAMAVSPDGRYVMSGEGAWYENNEWQSGKDFRLRLWDLETGRLVRHFAGHTKHVECIAFSSDGSRVVSGSFDKSIRLWEVATGKQLAVYEGHTGTVDGVALSPDGRIIASCGRDKTVRLWDVESRDEILKIEGHTDHVDSLAFSPDGSRLLTGSYDKTARLWAVETGKQLLSMPHYRQVYGVAISPDGRRALTGSQDGRVRLWDLESGLQIADFGQHKAQVRNAAFSPDGHRALSCGSNDARLWQLPSETAASQHAELPSQIPLDDWVSQRGVLTVAKDGSAMFDSIEAALQALKPGQVVKVLDKGPYRETWNLVVPEDVGLVSQVETRVELPKWHRFADSSTPGKSRYHGWRMECPRGIRLAGIEFVCETLPPDTGDALAVTLRAAGDIVVDHCRLLHAPRYSIAFPDYGDAAYRRFYSLTLEKFSRAPQRPCRLLLEENLLEGEVFTRFDYPAPTAIERNRMLGWRWSAVVMYGAQGSTAIRHNVIHGWNGIFITGRHSQSRFTIANNLIDTLYQPLVLMRPSDDRERNLPSKDMKFTNNIIRCRHGDGLLLPESDLAVVESDWEIGHNSYLLEPVSAHNYVCFPRQKTDVVETIPFATRDLYDADYLRIAVDGPLADSGAGGEFPNYIGPLPPGPAPKQGDWFTRLHSDWAAYQQPPPLTAAEMPVAPSLDDWLKGREVLTVAKDGSGKFKTIQAALDAIKTGQAIEVLDRGPYRETLQHNDLPAEIGLISRSGARVEIDSLRASEAGSPDAAYYTGWELGCRDGFRLSGVEFVCPELPQNTSVCRAVIITAGGNVTVEGCRVLHSPQYLLTSTENLIERPHNFIGFDIRQSSGTLESTALMTVRDNLIDGRLEIAQRALSAVDVVVERNRIIGWRNDALLLPHFGNRVLIRHNVVVGANGILLYDRPSHPAAVRNQARYLIVNNVIQTNGHPIAVFWPDSWEVHNLAAPVKNVRIVNNLLRSTSGIGITARADDVAVMKRHWQVEHNAYLREPIAHSNAAVLPLQKTDVVPPRHFLSDDPAQPGYLRIDFEGPLANLGAGGELPQYIGAFPPGPPPPDGDWYSKLLEAP